MPIGIMSLAPSERLGPYEILDQLGSGGMGVVYKALDPRLGRQVAIKVLLPEIASDEESLARFEREARAVAAISHANILGIYDFQREGSTVFTVMEFLEGGTLRNALANGPLPLRQAVRIAVQIANGLAAAHDRNFVHRDLKPENVGLTGDGQAKVLDFGLARHAADPNLTQVNLTTPGLILGTVNYMSPEQVRGEDLDHRSDLFSFGIVMHEMLTNRKPFERASAAETMTAILKDEPPEVTGSGTNLPPAIDRVIRRCLEKHPSDRFHSARDLAFALENALTPGRSDEIVRPPVRSRPRRLVPALCLVAGVGGGLLLSPVLRPPAVVEPVSVRQITMSGVDSEPSASPDGRFLAYTSSQGGVSRLWVRAIDTGGELPLASGHRPRFLPDQSVLFLRDDTPGGTEASGDSAWSIPMLGGKPPHLVLRGVVEVDAAPDGRTVAFVRSSDAGDVRTATLGVVPVEGGEERVLLTATDVEFSSARWSPDGRQVALIQRAATGSSTTAIRIVDAATGKARDLPAAAGTYGALAWNGDGQSLLVTNTDNAQVFVPGTPARVVRLDAATGRRETLFYAPNLFGLFGTSDANAGLDVLGPGAIVFDPVEIRQNLGAVRLDRPGASAAGAPDRLETSGNGLDRQPAFSPDGRFVLFTSNRSGNLDLWLLVAATGELRQLTNDPAQDWDPGFTPDGKHLLWSSNRVNRHLEIWTADFDATSLAVSGERQVSHDGEDAENPTMAAGSNTIVYGSGNAAKPGIWRVKADGTGATRLAAGPYSIPDVSPDGRYALFLEDDRVHLHRTIRVLDIAAPEHKTDFTIAVPYQVIEGSADITWGRARWMPDGRSIVFVAQDANGRSGLYTQSFVPGQDTSASRKLVASALAGATIESFGVASAADRIAVSNGYYSRSLKVAEGIPGVVVAANARR